MRQHRPHSLPPSSYSPMSEQSKGLSIKLCSDEILLRQSMAAAGVPSPSFLPSPKVQPVIKSPTSDLINTQTPQNLSSLISENNSLKRNASSHPPYTTSYDPGIYRTVHSPSYDSESYRTTHTPPYNPWSYKTPQTSDMRSVSPLLPAHQPYTHEEILSTKLSPPKDILIDIQNYTDTLSPNFPWSSPASSISHLNDIDTHKLGRSYTLSYTEFRSNALISRPKDNELSRYLLEAKLRKRKEFLNEHIDTHIEFEKYRIKLLEDRQRALEKLFFKPLIPEFLKPQISSTPPEFTPENILVRPHKRNTCHTVEEVDKIEKILKSKGSKILIDKFDIEITRDSLSCLLPEQWLNDEIINFYMAMLQERDHKLAQERSISPRCFIFNTFFFEKLMPSVLPTSKAYDYQAVRRWTLRRNVDIFNFDFILIPINISQSHWVLGCLKMRPGEREMFVLDSLNGKNERFFLAMKKYLKDEYKDKKGKELDCINDWTYPKDYMSSHDAPQQKNTSDCGVFICQFAECLSFGSSFDFTQIDIPSMRLKMALQIIQGSL